MNNDWRTELKETNNECYIRLCECRNNFNDLIVMTKLVIKYNPNETKMDCLYHILEWVGDWNNQFELTDLTKKELTKIKKALDIE